MPNFKTPNNTAQVRNRTADRAQRFVKQQLARKHEQNVEKYNVVRAELLLAQYAVAEVHPLVVGALGEWHPASEATLKMVSSGRKLTSLREQIISEAINGSAAIYYNHANNAYLVSREYQRPARP